MATRLTGIDATMLAVDSSRFTAYIGACVVLELAAGVAPRTPFNRPLSSHRRYAYGTVELARGLQRPGPALEAALTTRTW